MSQPIGRIRGLRACASARGTFGVLALDHRQNLRRLLRSVDSGSVGYDEMVAFKRAVVRSVGTAATGILLDPEVGAAQCIVDGSLPPGVGLLVALEATGYEGSSTDRLSRILDGWGPAQAKRMGASAAKLLIYYHPEAPSAQLQEELVGRVAAECAAQDLALFVEPLSFSIDPAAPALTGEERRRVVVETARRLTPLGGDILKAEFPLDSSVSDAGRWREACAELDEASSIPWVLLSGGVDDPTFESQVRVACASGASGVAVGRSVWGEAAGMAPAQRDAFLRTEARTRLERMVAEIDDLASPWDSRPGSLVEAASVDNGWYRDYDR